MKKTGAKSWRPHCRPRLSNDKKRMLCGTCRETLSDQLFVVESSGRTQRLADAFSVPTGHERCPLQFRMMVAARIENTLFALYGDPVHLHNVSEIIFGPCSPETKDKLKRITSSLIANILSRTVMRNQNASKLLLPAFLLTLGSGQLPTSGVTSDELSDWRTGSISILGFDPVDATDVIGYFDVETVDIGIFSRNTIVRNFVDVSRTTSRLTDSVRSLPRMRVSRALYTKDTIHEETFENLCRV